MILFTHDITFLMLLQEHAEIKDIPIHVKSLTRKRRETGLVRENPPWDAMSIKRRIGFLNSLYQNLRKIDRDGTEDEYKYACQNFYGRLRESWERFVEEIFLNSTIQRFGREIQTKRLSKIVDLTPQDYDRLGTNMSKCSTFFVGHDTSGNLIENMPDISDAKNDLEDLISFRQELIKRRK